MGKKEKEEQVKKMKRKWRTKHQRERKEEEERANDKDQNPKRLLGRSNAKKEEKGNGRLGKKEVKRSKIVRKIRGRSVLQRGTDTCR